MQTSHNFKPGDKVVYKDGTPMSSEGGFRVVQSIAGEVVRYVGVCWDWASDLVLLTPPSAESYKLIEHSNPDALSTAVNKAILEGFKPIGGVSMSMHKHYMQAMLKE